MQTRTVHIHDEPVLWPEHKMLNEVLETRDTTQEHVWETTYQGYPTSPKGKLFERDWWNNKNRYTGEQIVAIYLSLDTALSDQETAAMSVISVLGLLADYRICLLDMWANRVQYPQLTSKTIEYAMQYKFNNQLYGIIIENKVSGISLIQTLKQTAPKDIADLVIAYTPKYAKDIRWGEAAVWCKLGMVLLPMPSPAYPWLFELEKDLYDAPDIQVKDRLDSFTQGILALSQYLSQGYSVKAGY